MLVVDDHETVRSGLTALLTAELGIEVVGQAEALRPAAGGAYCREIAADLSLSVGTVRNRLSSAVGKLHARTLVDAVRIAKEQGWV